MAKSSAVCRDRVIKGQRKVFVKISPNICTFGGTWNYLVLCELKSLEKKRYQSFQIVISQDESQREAENNAVSLHKLHKGVRVC